MVQKQRFICHSPLLTSPPEPSLPPLTVEKLTFTKPFPGAKKVGEPLLQRIVGRFRLVGRASTKTKKRGSTEWIQVSTSSNEVQNGIACRGAGEAAEQAGGGRKHRPMWGVSP